MAFAGLERPGMSAQVKARPTRPAIKTQASEDDLNLVDLDDPDGPDDPDDPGDPGAPDDVVARVDTSGRAPGDSGTDT